MTLELVNGTTSGSSATLTSPDVISIGGALASFDFTSSIGPRSWIPTEQTNSGESQGTGVDQLEERPTTGDAIAELRRLSGLTWEQLAQIFGVARRSLHFWASGKPLSANNEQKLYRLLGIARAIDRGSPRRNRTLLLSALPGGQIPLDLLADDHYDVVLKELSAGTRPQALAVRPQGSDIVLEARSPTSPENRVGALHDSVHAKPGGRRSRRAARLSKK